MLDRFKKSKAPIPHKKIGVDYRICHFCGACVGACPPDAIFLENAHLRIDSSCTSCERCIPACPLGALYLIDLPLEAAA